MAECRPTNHKNIQKSDILLILISQISEIPPQVLTKDSVTIMVDAVIYYRVFNPTVSITKVENATHATQMLAQTTLRNMLGTKSLADILKDREEMSDQMEVKAHLQNNE